MTDAFLSDDANKSIKELRPYPLKKLTIKAIEEAFSKALSGLTGEEYDVDVHSLRLGTAIGQCDAAMEISVSKKLYLGDFK